MAKKSTPPTVRQRVRVYLAQRDITQGQLADELGIDESYLSLIIRGRRHPSLDVAVRLERLTGIPASEFADAEVAS